MKTRLLSALVLLVLAVLWGIAAFHDYEYLRFGDWDQYLSFFEMQRRSISIYGELPLWNPYLLGGIPGHAHPQFNTLSPYFLPMLLWGSVNGTAIYFTLHTLTGLTGMYLLARHWNCSRMPSLMAAVIFTYAMAPMLSGGVVNRVNGSLVPWMVLTFALACSHPRWIAGLALVIALLLLEGGFYSLVGGGIFIGLLVLLRGRPAAILKSSGIGLLGLLLGLGLCAIRLLPTVELYLRFPRATEVYLGKPWWSMEAIPTFLSAIAALLNAPVIGRRDELFGQQIFLGMQMGIPLLATLLLATVHAWRRWRLWILLSVFLCMVLGSASPLNLFALVQRLPGLKSLNLPASLVFPLMIPLSLLIAETASTVAERVFSSKRAALGLECFLFLFAALLPLFWQQWTILEKHERFEQPPSADANAPFMTTAGSRMAMLPSVRSNQGVLFAYEEVIRTPLEEAWKAQQNRPRASDERTYRGEWFFDKSTSRLELRRFSPNERAFQISCTESDVITLNQNYFPGWTAMLDSTSLPVENRGGLLAVSIPAASGTLVLRYEPASFRVGTWISIGFLILWTALLWPPIATRLFSWSTAPLLRP